MNNFFSLSEITFTRNEWNVTIVYNLRHESGISRRHAVRKKFCWFHFTSLLLAGGVLLMEFTTKKSRFIFSLPDALLLLLFGIVLISYDKDENLQPERFLFIAQLVALWFMLRGALQAHQELRPFFISQYHIYRNRFRPSGGSAMPSILLPSPILSSGCLKHR